MFNKEYRTAVIISLVLHLVLFILLLGGSWFSGNEKKPQHRMVEAVVIDPQAIEQQAKSIRDERDAAKKAEQQRVERLRKEAEQQAEQRKKEQAELRRKQEEKVLAEKKAREEEKERKLAEKKRKEAEEQARIERAKAEKLAAEKKAQEELAAKKAAEEKAAAEKKAAEAKAKAQAEAKEQARVEAERKAKAQAEAKAEAARKAKLEQERAAEDAALNDIFSGLEAETEQLSTAKQRYAASELDRYGSIYKQMIQDKLLTEDSFRGKSCKINIRLLQTGKDAIVSKVTSIDGDSALCSAAKRAVAQVGSFPMPDDKDVADKLKNINLIVAPE